jgi:hypothetical protein
MEALAGYSSDSSEEGSPSSPKNPRIFLPTSHHNVNNCLQADSEENSSHVSNRETSVALLEPPPLSEDSMLFGDIDLFSSKYTPICQSNLLNKNNNQPRIDSSCVPTSWVHQIQSEHEFHNPAFFQSALQNLGIKDELGTNASCQEIIYSYEYDLVRLEEEARIRQYQNVPVATPSPFAQKQLERVMQQRR